jgi:hypothetical protein
MCKEQLFDLMNENLDIVKEWIQENLYMTNEAKKLTGQSIFGFRQSVTSKLIKPFVSFGDKKKTYLYLKQDLLEYAKNKRGR